MRLRAIEFQVSDLARIGHVHLRVSDLDRATAFYCDVLGFKVKADARAIGVPAVFLAAGDYHHHIALNTFEGTGLQPAPAGHTGLFHLAIVLPDREALARAVAHVAAGGWQLDGGRDHGATVSVYLRDADRNGIELYYDRPQRDWFDAEGRPLLRNDVIDLAALIAEAEHVGV